MARKPKRLRRLQITEGSLVDRGACPGAVISFYKRDKAMTVDDIVKRLEDPEQEIDRADVDQLLRDHLRETMPEADYGTALLKSWGRDPALASLYSLHQAAPAEVEPEAPVAKAIPGDTAWQEITKLARAAVDAAGGKVTFSEALDRVLIDQPKLYAAYLREQQDDRPEED